VAKILIVDDQRQFRKVLELALKSKGYDIREAASGSDALAVMRSEALDLILADWRMPGMNGLDLCRAIRATSDVPIIMVTSKQDGRSEALAAGADDYIKKPFDVDDLLARVESALTK
jgi:DNA-binding response OmpR family regulator